MDKRYYKAESYKVLESVGYLVCRGRNLITMEIEKLFTDPSTGLHINFSQWAVLMCLRDDLARTPTDIAQHICHDTGAMTRIIDCLEKRKWLKRKRSLEDRRIVELSLTPAGRKAAESHIALIAQFYNELLADFTVTEADMLIHLLTRLISRLSSQERSFSKAVEPEILDY